jgi:hypothetical protein
MKISNISLVWILTISFFSIISCTDEKPETPIAQKPIPDNSKQVNIIVDGSFDLRNTVAHSLLDSIPMTGSLNELYIPESYESAVFFLDDNSGEILAVVKTDTLSNNLVVNAKTVTNSLLEFIPAYSSLPEDLRIRFINEASGIPVYIDLVTTVEKLLKDKKPIYSSESAFIDQILQLNKHILKNYLGDPNLEGGRIKSDDDFSKWITCESGATLDNQVHSFVYAEFVPKNGGNTITTLIDPQPILLGQWSRLKLSSLNLKDDCYTVNINQTHESAVSKNFYELSSRLAKMFLNTVLGRLGSSSRNDCIAAISLSIQLDITSTILEIGGGANLTPKGLLIKISQTAGNTIQTAFTQSACQKTLLNKSVIAKALLAQSNLFNKIIEGAAFAYELSEYIPFVIAQIDPVNLTEKMQLYEGNLKEACVKVERDEELKEEYSPGEIIYPGIKLIAESQYAGWEKSGFKVEWKILPGNGSINLSSTSTSNEGKSSVGWTLPTDINEASLIAEIKDKEGDHLEGSPIKFQTKIVDVDSTEIYEAHLFGNWKVDIYYAGSDTKIYTDYVTINSTAYWVYQRVWPNGTTQVYNPMEGPYEWEVFFDASDGYIFRVATQYSGRLSYPISQMIATSFSWDHHFTRL